MSRVFAWADLFGSWIMGNLERSLEKHASVTFSFMHYLNMSTTIWKNILSLLWNESDEEGF